MGTVSPIPSAEPVQKAVVFFTPDSGSEIASRISDFLALAQYRVVRISGNDHAMTVDVGDSLSMTGPISCQVVDVHAAFTIPGIADYFSTSVGFDVDPSTGWSVFFKDNHICLRLMMGGLIRETILLIPT